MKEKVSWIVTVSLAVLLAIFTILKEEVWGGFVYFVFALCAVLACFWGGWLIYLYLTDFKAELEDRFTVFKAEQMVKLSLSGQEFDEDEPAQRKIFKKRLRKEKFLKWFLICFCFAAAATFIVAIILY